MKLKGIRLLGILSALLLFGSLFTGVFAEDADEKIGITLNAGEYGYFEDSFGFEKIVEYEPGEHFRPDEAVPLPVRNYFEFDGWYTGFQGKGERYTAETVIDGTCDRLYANWKPVPSAIPVMKADTVYSLEVAEGILYSFTPSETALYEIYTTGNDPYEGVPNLIVRDEKLISLAQSRPMDEDNNAIVSLELTAGTVYYIELGSTFSIPITYDVILIKSTLIPVTFHANPEKPGEAYFDGDPDLTVKTMDIRKGQHLEKYTGSGLEITDTDNLFLVGWSTDPDAQTEDDEIILTEPIDVYAVYDRYKSVMIDANGGYFPTLGPGITEYKYPYRAEWAFEPFYSPATDDDSVMFAGWATTKDALEPDILEGEYYDDIPVDVLYAVYSEPVTVTFDAGGGYIFGNENMHIYQTVFGKGHVFYQLHVEYGNEPMELLGWVDQDGVVIPAGRDTYPGYQYMKDTTLTAVWGRYIDVCATYGCFHFSPGNIWTTILFPIDEPFDRSVIATSVGEPVYVMSDDPVAFDDMKYLAGWASNWDIEEPDIVDGVTDVMELKEIYAIWKDDSYYIAEEDETWEKGSEKGYSITIKRIGDDEMTDVCFRSLKVDEEEIEDFSRKAGSIILTINPEYLEKLKAGEHRLQVVFTQDEVVDATFTIIENEEPDTGDHADAVTWSLLMGLSWLGMVSLAVFGKRKKN